MMIPYGHCGKPIVRAEVNVWATQTKPAKADLKNRKRNLHNRIWRQKPIADSPPNTMDLGRVTEGQVGRKADSKTPFPLELDFDYKLVV